MARRPYSFLDPLTSKALRRQAVRYANAQFGPVLAQINAEYNRRAQAGASSIGAGTQQLATALAPAAGQTAGYYSQAKAEQAALDDPGVRVEQAHRCLDHSSSPSSQRTRMSPW